MRKLGTLVLAVAVLLGLNATAQAALVGIQISDTGIVGHTGPCTSGTLVDNLDGSFTLDDCGGHDLHGNADSFFFAYDDVMFSGDGEVIARVTNFDTGGQWSRVGLDFRASLSAGSVHFSACLADIDAPPVEWRGINTHRHDTNGGSERHADINDLTLPRWLKIVRSGGTTFEAFQSTDGSTWLTMGGPQVMANLTGDLYVGLAGHGRNDTTYTDVTFDNLGGDAFVFEPVLYWDDTGDGNWVEATTRWSTSDPPPVVAPAVGDPQEPNADITARIVSDATARRVTVNGDYEAYSLKVENSEVLIGAGNRLRVGRTSGGGASFDAGSTLILESGTFEAASGSIPLVLATGTSTISATAGTIALDAMVAETAAGAAAALNFHKAGAGTATLMELEIDPAVLAASSVSADEGTLRMIGADAFGDMDRVILNGGILSHVSTSESLKTNTLTEQWYSGNFTPAQAGRDADLDDDVTLYNGIAPDQIGPGLNVPLDLQGAQMSRRSLYLFNNSLISPDDPNQVGMCIYGTMKVETGGLIEPTDLIFFGVNSDDTTTMWLDLDGDGDFEKKVMPLDPSEEIATDTAGGAPAMEVNNIQQIVPPGYPGTPLPEGDYKVAFLGQEGGGGEYFRMKFWAGSQQDLVDAGTPDPWVNDRDAFFNNVMRWIDPSDPAQDGVWKGVTPDQTDLSGITFTATAGTSSGIHATSVNYDDILVGNIVMENNSEVATSSDGYPTNMALTQITFDTGAASAGINPETNTILPTTIVNSSGGPATLKVGGSDELIARDGDGSGIPNDVTIQVEPDGHLVNRLASDPLDGVNVALNGGLFSIGKDLDFRPAIEGRIYTGGARDNSLLDGVGDGTGSGGLLGKTPLTTAFYENRIDYQSDADFRYGNADRDVDSTGLTQNDDYQSMFIAVFNAPVDGTYEFGMDHCDDPARIYLDLNQNGIFETANGEMVCGRDCCGPLYNTVDLTAGQYLYAATHHEFGGGSANRPTIQVPGGPRMAVYPSNPSQAGWWGLQAFGDFSEFSVGAQVSVLADSTLAVYSGAGTGTVASLAMNKGITLTTRGSGMLAFAATTLGADAGAGEDFSVEFAPGPPTILSGIALPASPGAITVVQNGPGDLVVNDAAPPAGMGNVTFSVKGGRLVGWNPLGGAGVSLVGGNFAYVGAEQTEPGMIHYGYNWDSADGELRALVGNQGLMATQEDGSRVMTDGPNGRGLDYNWDGDFYTAGVGITRDDPQGNWADHFMNLWVSDFYPAAGPGDYVFKINQDDDICVMWFDHDGDGVFAPGDEIAWEDQGAKTITITQAMIDAAAGGNFMFAAGHREGGGGSGIEVAFQAPGMGALEVIKPATPAHGDYFKVTQNGPFDINTVVDVAVDGTVEAVTNFEGRFGGMVLHEDATVTTTASDRGNLVFDATTLVADGASGVVGIHTLSDTNITGADPLTGPGDGETLTVLKTGRADLVLDQIGATGVAGTTFDVNQGRMVVSYGSDALGGADVVLSGGTYAAKGEDIVVSALRHLGLNWQHDDMIRGNSQGGGGGLHLNRGALAMTPDGTALLTDGPGGRGLDFNNDMDFVNAGVGITEDGAGWADNYMNVWIADFVPEEGPGDYQFDVEGDDDRSGMWLDLNGDGVFDYYGGEEIAWEDGGTKTIAITQAMIDAGGGSLKFAAVHREGGGGSHINVRFKSPSMAGLESIKPGDPNHSDFWKTDALDAVDIGNELTVDVTTGFHARRFNYQDDAGLNDVGNTLLAPATIPNGGETRWDGALSIDERRNFLQGGLVDAPCRFTFEDVLPGHNDNYMYLFVAEFNALAGDGVYNFSKENNDDFAVVYLDENQDGVFQDTEKIGPGQWGPANRDYNLIGGQTYLYAYGHREGGGASYLEGHYTPPGGLKTLIDPEDPAQAGVWGAPDPFWAPSYLELMTDYPSNLQKLVLKNGDLQVIGGKSLTVGSAEVSTATGGTVGLGSDVPLILTDVAGFNGNGQGATIKIHTKANITINKDGVGLGDTLGEGVSTFKFELGQVDVPVTDGDTASGVPGSVPFGDPTVLPDGDDADLMFAGLGTLRIEPRAVAVVAGVGLDAGMLSGSFDETSPNPATQVDMGPVMAQVNVTGAGAGEWQDNTTWVYTGLMYDADGLLSFVHNFDDSVLLTIDGTQYMRDTNWNNITSTGPLDLGMGPAGDGWHAIEMRFGQGTGGAGPNQSPWNDPDLPTVGYGMIGFGLDPDGGGTTDKADYVAPVDPGDGSLFQRGYFQIPAIDWSTGNDIYVNGGGKLIGVTDLTATFNIVKFSSGILGTAGAAGGMYFNTPTIEADGTSGVSTECTTYFPNSMDGKSHTAIFVKTGGDDLVMTGQGTGQENLTYDVQAGNLVSISASNPVQDATLRINGGEITLTIEDKTPPPDIVADYTSNAVEVLSDGTLTAGSGGYGEATDPVTVNLGGPTKGMALTSGMVTVRSTEDYTLKVLGPLSGTGIMWMNEGKVELNGGGSGGTAVVSGTADVKLGQDVALQKAGLYGGSMDTQGNNAVISEQVTLDDVVYGITSGPMKVRGDTATGMTLRLDTAGAVLAVNGLPAITDEHFPTHQDIGTTGDPALAGDYSYAADVHTITGGGTDVWDDVDHFHYAYTEIDNTDSVEIFGHVDNITAGNGWIKTGFMVRNSVGPLDDADGNSCAHASAAVTWNNGQALQGRRDDEPSNTLENRGAVGGVRGDPAWVRLVVTGAQAEYWVSTQPGDTPLDLIQWGGYQTFNFDRLGVSGEPDELKDYVGIFLTSHDNAVLETAEISRVHMSINGTPLGVPDTVDDPATNVEVMDDATITSGADNVTLGNMLLAAGKSLVLQDVYVGVNDLTAGHGSSITGDMSVSGDVRVGSVGTLTVDGELELAEATYWCEVDSTGADLIDNISADLPIVLGEDATLELMVLESLGAPGCYTERILQVAGAGEIEDDFGTKPAEGDYLAYGVFLDSYDTTLTYYDLNMFQANKGDTDGDGDVDLDDLSDLDDGWGPTATDRTWLDGDFDGDGNVDLDDLSDLDDAWAPAGYPVVNCPFAGGGAGAGAAAVPEPGTLALLTMAAVGILLFYQRRRAFKNITVATSSATLAKARKNPMRTKLLSLLVLAVVVALAGTAYGEPIAAYRILIGPPHTLGSTEPTPGGVQAPVHVLTPGETYGLTVEILVEQNPMVFGGVEYQGGAYFVGFNMNNDPDRLRGVSPKPNAHLGTVAYAMKTITFPPPARPDWKWNSDKPAEFTTWYPGGVAATLGGGEFYSLYNQGGMIPVDNRWDGENPFKFGGAAAGPPQPAPISWGNFVFTSENTLMTLEPSSGASTKVFYQAEPDGEVVFISIGDLYPDLSMEDLVGQGLLVGDETMLQVIPEPSTFVLLAMGLVGLLLVWRRRR